MIDLDGLFARLEFVRHYLAGHNAKWRVNTDELCAGDIMCYACPETSDGISNLIIWCRGMAGE